MVKENEPIKIDVEDLDEAVKAEEGQTDIADELRNLGRQFAETVQSAWNSDERQRLEKDFREGFKNFSEEVNKVFSEIKSSPAAQKVREEAGKVDKTEVAQKTKSAVSSGLQWLSRELSELSEKLNQEEPPAEKSETQEM
ncbi:MAG: hypothetical protein QNJ45_11330 [Ardenticatenaceae bacterium]|nr:hypothetical protein [Ardenticatenaceae bacterium]